MKFLLILLTFLSCNVEAKEYVFKGRTESKVTFRASGNPGFLRIDGSVGEITGSLKDAKEGYQGILEVDLKNAKTGIELRDKHLKEKYLEVDKFPKATLELKAVKPSKELFQWTGFLTLKNNTKPVHGTASLDGDKLKANFSFSLTDYPEVGIPSWLGVTVAEKVDVSVSAVLE